MADARLPQLGPDDRRKVLAAVRSGERLDDPRLRPHAVAMATRMLRSTRRWEWTHRHRWWVAGFFLLGAVLGVVGMMAGTGGSLRLFNVVVSLLLLVLFLALDPVFTRFRVNADLALQRNGDGAAESAP